MARLLSAVPIIALVAGVAAAGPPPGGGRAPYNLPTSPFGGTPKSPAGGGGGWGNALSIAGAALAASGGGHPPQAHKYIAGGGGFANPNAAAAVGQILGAIGQANVPQGQRYQAGSGGGLGNAMSGRPSFAPAPAGGLGNPLSSGGAILGSGGWMNPVPTSAGYTPTWPAYTPQPSYTPQYAPQPTYSQPPTSYPSVVGGSGGAANPVPVGPTSAYAPTPGSYPTVVGSAGGAASPVPGPVAAGPMDPPGTVFADPPFGTTPPTGSPFAANANNPLAGTPSQVSIRPTDPAPDPPPVEQWYRNRFVKLRNQSGQPLTFHVRYHKLTPSGGLWLPGEGSLPPVRLLPGEEADLMHAGYRVTADKIRFTVVTDDGTKFAKYNTRDYVLGGPAERDANGDLRYWAARVGTYTYTVTPPSKRS